MSQTATDERPAAPASPPKMTYEEFLNWVDEDTHAEWVDGEVVFMSPVSNVHQRIVLFLVRLLADFVDAHDLGTLLYAEFQMKLVGERAGREPDLLFVSKSNLALLEQNYLNGPGDLAVEIISPESVERDWEDKFTEYESGGVQEYWLIDPLQQQADFFLRDASGRFQPVPVGDDGIYRSATLTGFWLRVAWLWQSPSPALPVVRKELGLP